MKKAILITLFLSTATCGFAQEYYSNWAIGVRAGEPLGANIRKYFADGEKAFDINVGTYGFFWGRQKYYGKDRSSGDKKLVYDGAGFQFQGLYNWHKALFRREALHLTYGFGGQLNSRRLYQSDRTSNAIRQISVGPAVAAGLEYKLPNNDLAVFLDGGGYVELLPRPFLSHPQLSGGVRLNIVR